MQSNPIIKYGVHSVAAINRETGLLYGMARVIGSASLSLTGDLNELTGGSSPYPWSVQNGLIKTELSLKLKEYPPFLYELFAGHAPTVTTTASTTGEVTELKNKKGTSVVSATTGVASIGLKSEKTADVKFFRGVIKAVSATTVDVYAYSNVDFGRGTSLKFQDDLGKITETPLTISGSGETVEIPGTGLELTGGSGTVAMTVGDTAEFESTPTYSKKIDVGVGSVTDVYPEFSMIIVGEPVDKNQLNELTVHRCKGIGLPLGFDEKAFSNPEVKLKTYLDTDKDEVYRERVVVATAS